MQVVIRTDASVLIGRGHVMRCLALAEALAAASVNVAFICREHGGHLCRQIASRGFKVLRLARPDAAATDDKSPRSLLGVEQHQDAEETLFALKTLGPVDWLVVDHYALDKEWESAVGPSVNRILVIDDLANRPHFCDRLLDTGRPVGATSSYASLLPPACELILGPRNILLGPGFQLQTARKVAVEAKRIMVFMGSSDVENHTEKVLRGLLATQSASVRIHVVVGSTNPNISRLEEVCSRHDHVRMRVDAGNMVQLLRRSDIAVGVGGVSMWERCALGLPAVVVASARNQVPGCELAASAGAIVYLGTVESVSPDLVAQAVAVLQKAKALREHMSLAAMRLVDGRGAARVARMLFDHTVYVRRAEAKDCEPMFEWRSDIDTVSMTMSNQVLEPDTHRAWFEAVLHNREQALLVAEMPAGEAVGVIRFDRRGAVATVSIYLVPAAKGKGLGSAVLQAGTSWLRTHWPRVTALEAMIKDENSASLNCFAAAGYTKCAAVFRLELGQPPC